VESLFSVSGKCGLPLFLTTEGLSPVLTRFIRRESATFSFPTSIFNALRQQTSALLVLLFYALFPCLFYVITVIVSNARNKFHDIIKPDRKFIKIFCHTAHILVNIFINFCHHLSDLIPGVYLSLMFYLYLIRKDEQTRQELSV